MGRFGRREKRIGQRQSVDSGHGLVLFQLRIEEEHHRPFRLFMRAQLLLAETEAGNLVEPGAGLIRRDVEPRLRRGRLVGQVFRAEENRRGFAGAHQNFRRFRPKTPVEARRDVGVETHRDLAQATRCGRAIRCLSRAAVAGGGAEHAIKRHGGERGAQHQDRDKADRRSDVALRVFRVLPGRSAAHGVNPAG